MKKLALSAFIGAVFFMVPPCAMAADEPLILIEDLIPILADEICGVMPLIYDEYWGMVEEILFTGIDLEINEYPDYDANEYPEIAPLSLIEVLVCVGPTIDPDNTDLENVDYFASMLEAAETAYTFNLAVFDAEPFTEEIAIELEPFRHAIATMMMVGGEMQALLEEATFEIFVEDVADALEDDPDLEPDELALLLSQLPDEVFHGIYFTVQCAGDECTPFDDVLFADNLVQARNGNEPFSTSGDMDRDGTNNVTEFKNVANKLGFLSDFATAATSKALNGTELIRTPGADDRARNGGGGCFIATAAYGTPLAVEIEVFRDYRDTHLMSSSLGAVFVDSYYRLSPAIADTIASRPVLKSAVRVGLAPVVWLVRFPWMMLVLMVGLVLFATRRVVRG